jgi:endonuclease/exonuclease/phosphatase family metal-dependent hydrolase
MLRVFNCPVSVRVAPESGDHAAGNAAWFRARGARLVHQLVLVPIAICSLAAAVSAQTTVTLNTRGTHINADLTIQGGGYGWADFSDSESLASKVSTESYTRRILMKFDTQNFIPANTTIQSAVLHLVLKKAENSEGRPLTAYHVNQSFVTGGTNWYEYRSGQRWNTPGGDYGSSYGTTYVGDAEGWTYKFDLTTLVQRAVNGELGSRYTRLALIDTGAHTDGNYREFHSTRASNSALRPRLVITYGATAAAAPPPPPPPPPPSGTTLRVMQWNVHKTKGSDGRCDPDRIATRIVSQNPHVVSLNEVNFFSGECAWTFNMGAKLESLLEQKTGVAWYRRDANVYSGTNGYGNVLLSRYPLTSSGSTLLSYSRSVAHIGIVVNGRNVNLFSTHVEYYSSSWRPIQIAEAVRWITSFAEPRIVMGDFNTWPNTTDYSIIASKIPDAWVAALASGTASSYNGTGATHGSSRFDYVFYSKYSVLSLKSVNVPNMRVNGVNPADHDPVVAVFNVN